MQLIQKVEKKKYKSSKTFKKQMQRANKRIQAWGKKNLTSNDINMYKKFIKNFNERLGLEGDEFITTKWYTKMQGQQR